jgi:hypothetical protein
LKAFWGSFLHDFHFERDVQDENQGKVLSSAIKVSDGEQPPSNKYKTDGQAKKSNQNDSREINSKFGSGNVDGEQQMNKTSCLLTSKLERSSNQDIQKSKHKCAIKEEHEGGVYTLEDSETESETL